MAWGERQGAGQARRIGVWWTVGALVALAVIAWGGWLMARPEGGDESASAGHTSVPTASPLPSDAGDGGARGPTSDAAPEKSKPTTPSGEGPQAEPQTGPGQPVRLPGLPPAPGPSSLVSSPLPSDATARGRVVAGFPGTVLPTPRWAHVRSSSVSSGHSTLQASLRAGIGRRGQALLEHYRKALVRQGFAESDTPALEGQQAVTFSRKRDNVVVTVDPKHSSYSLYAVLHATPR